MPIWIMEVNYILSKQGSNSSFLKVQNSLLFSNLTKGKKDAKNEKTSNKPHKPTRMSMAV
jgi:hypothetical protein